MLFNPVLYNDMYFGGRHSGGCNFTMADGSVHFINETIRFDVYQHLTTIAGGETDQL